MDFTIAKTKRKRKFVFYLINKCYEVGLLTINLLIIFFQDIEDIY